jgi:hypothetical protein
MEDVRYSSIRYVASTTRNAVGPSVSDPRSGEIIESDIVWYHNHLRSYRNRYLLETGAANPLARTLDTPQEEIGEMMRMVISHEIGHALGLPHNMAASYAYPVDSLRSGEFTQKNGIAATIMDYARYNYVAQPGDKNIRFIRQLGPYDHYSINWGYRVLPNIKNSADETKTLDKWISDKGNDPVYKFGIQRRRGFDPESQTEGIGNNQVKASTYGVKNLKIVAKNLQNWTSDQTNNYDDLSELHRELLGVFSRYSGHVTGIIGGVTENNKKPEQDGYIYTNSSKTSQKEAMKWLQNNVFNNVEWLIPNEIIKNINSSGHTGSILKLQNRQLFSLLSTQRLQRMIDAELTQEDLYSTLDMFRDLRNGLFSEIKTNKNVTIYRRNIQKSFIEKISSLMNTKDIKTFDLFSIFRGELIVLKNQLTSINKKNINLMTRYHYDDCLARIKNMLNPNK